jgi:hypothetical protein
MPNDDCKTAPQPPISQPANASNEFKFRYDLGQVVDGNIAPIDACYYSTGGGDGTLFVVCGTLLKDCVVAKA